MCQRKGMYLRKVALLCLSTDSMLARCGTARTCGEMFSLPLQLGIGVKRAAVPLNVYGSGISIRMLPLPLCLGKIELREEVSLWLRVSLKSWMLVGAMCGYMS